MGSVSWSFLKVLENPSMGSKNLDQNDDVYVHPMVKRSASALSTKSLEMCTESLGSETGSEGSESGDEFCPISVEERERLKKIQENKYRNFGRKTRRSEFPPPLTSISGSDGAVKVNHHREGGRLVIKAVSISNCGTSFIAERANGRLKLSLLRGCCGDNESVRGEMEEFEEEGDDVESEVVAETAEVCGGDWRRDVAGKGGLELTMLTRCKIGNGNKVFANWRGSSCVAIS